MSIKLSLCDSAQWRMLEAKGYTISINQAENDNSTLEVTFKTSHSGVTHVLPTSYSTSFTYFEIIKDVLPELMKWSGLKAHIVLDY